MRVLLLCFSAFLAGCYTPRLPIDETVTTTTTTTGDADTDSDADSDTDTDADTDTVTPTGDTASTTTSTGGSGTTGVTADTGSIATGDTGTPACVPVAEVCDGIDQDCDGVADNGLDVTLHEDADGDGYGSAAEQIFACDADTAGFVADGTDCDDTDASAHVFTDWYLDEDGDTFTDAVVSACGNGGLAAYLPSPSTEVDCDDTDEEINPGAVEIVGNCIDENCDGIVGAGCSSCPAGQSVMEFEYTSEPGATNVVVSVEQDNFGMNVISEGSPVGWHVASDLDLVTNVTMVNVWSDTCVPDATLWQASASFDGGWDCVGALASFRGSWRVYDEDGVLQSSTYVLNGLGGCELQVQ